MSLLKITRNLIAVDVFPVSPIQYLGISLRKSLEIMICTHVAINVRTRTDWLGKCCRWTASEVYYPTSELLNDLAHVKRFKYLFKNCTCYSSFNETVSFSYRTVQLSKDRALSVIHQRVCLTQLEIFTNTFTVAVFSIF